MKNVMGQDKTAKKKKSVGIGYFKTKEYIFNLFWLFGLGYTIIYKLHVSRRKF